MSDRAGDPRTSKTEWEWRRREVIIRDDYECQNPECDAKGGPRGNAALHVHHITAVVKEGGDEQENLETLCEACHSGGYAHPEGFSGEAEASGEAVRTSGGMSRDTGNGQYVKTYTTDVLAQAIDDLGGYATTKEIAEEIGASQSITRRRLREFAEDEGVSRREAGNTYIWENSDD
jgi:hypothetical protein